jgi:hypothetical protein
MPSFTLPTICWMYYYRLQINWIFLIKIKIYFWEKGHVQPCNTLAYHNIVSSLLLTNHSAILRYMSWAGWDCSRFVFRWWLVWILATMLAVLSILVLSGKCHHDSATIRLWLLPSSSFTIHHSPVILPFDTIQSELLTASQQLWVTESIVIYV